ncbi:hypothetical protein N8H74_28505 [Pseudomonas sp. B2M1-30]|uniref:hypothetical protein n=1 Tax=Pseudomonas TaxID=286 RepID=UPI0021C99B04|nr:MULTISPECIES: hypothetical protein [Pseudomonas]MCU0122214.1 hypothetical protein [Pseudomonas sp. B2M1-30]MCU7264467.1 hypothetical protein [Pseudomonas koreensis]
MNITIIRLIKNLSNRAHVEFSTPYGNGFSNFIGSQPKENQSYDIEIDINDDFYWNKNIFVSDKKTPSIEFKGDALYITAELINIAEDGCAALKLGNSLLLISISDEHRDKKLPFFVDITAKDTAIYTTNI